MGRIIDAVGVENIRENVVMDKMQFDVAGDEWRELLKERIMDQIEKYFMLIVFALYCKEAGPDGFSQTFSSWLSGTSYQDQIATGKGKSVCLTLVMMIMAMATVIMMVMKTAIVVSLDL